MLVPDAENPNDSLCRSTNMIINYVIICFSPQPWGSRWSAPSKMGTAPSAAPSCHLPVVMALWGGRDTEHSLASLRAQASLHFGAFSHRSHLASSKQDCPEEAKWWLQRGRGNGAQPGSFKWPLCFILTLSATGAAWLLQGEIAPKKPSSSPREERRMVHSLAF